MEKVISKELKDFFADYLMWVRGGKSRYEYNRYSGLCDNLTYIYYDYRQGLSREMKDLFEYEGLNRYYPFNRNANEYYNEAIDRMCHLNEKRLAFVERWMA